MRNVHGIIPPRHGDGILVKNRLSTCISSDELAFDSDLFPVAGIADTDKFKLFSQFFFTDFLFLIVVTENFIVDNSFLLLIVDERIGIVFEGYEFVLIDFLLLNVVKYYYILAFEVIMDYLLYVLFVYIFDVGWTSSKVIENVAYLQIMKVEVSLLNLGIGFL